VKFFFDFLPVIVFFVAYKVAGIFAATALAIVTSLAMIAWSLARGRKVAGMQWASFGIIVVFGGATLLLHDETFIKWKPSVLYWLSGAVFLGGLAFRANLVRAVIGADIVLPERIWTQLAVAWGVFFLLLGTLNLWVAYHFSTDTWVNFKLFGGVGLILAFVLTQAVWLSRHVQEPPAQAGPES
jgi:intracellular septation protein